MYFQRLAIAMAATLALAACGGSDDHDEAAPTQPGTEIPGGGTPDPGTPPTEPEPEPETPPAPEPVVLLDERFDGIATGALPAGWQQANGVEGAVYVQEGSLFVNGLANNSTATAVRLPASLASRGDYRIDAEFTIVQANNTSRWVSVMYRTSDTPNLEPYYQMAVRQTATAGNGTELAQRKDGGWIVSETAAFSEAIQPGKTYKATVIVKGGRVRQYLNDVLLHDAELGGAAQGGLGLQAAGAIMRVDAVKVTEQLEALPSLGDIYDVAEPQTGVAMAPTLVELTQTAATASQAGAANSLVTLDSALNVSTASGQSLGTLQALLERADARAIPVLRIADAATVSALAEQVKARNLVDLTLLSTDPALLAQARQAMPRVRAAVDYTQSSVGGGTADLARLVAATNQAGAKIAVLPAAAATRETVAYLQRMLVTVWAVPQDGSALSAARLLTSGVNGVVAADLAPYTALLAKFPARSLLRKPLVVGHRGVPSRVDENTLAGAIEAVRLGADAVENDIYMTTDRHLVVMHDETVDRTTDGTGAVESMSLAQVRALRTTSGLPVPTLDEFFTQFKGQPITHFVEIKSATPEVVDLLKVAVDRHGVADQVIAISFHAAQLKRLAELMPGVSGGYLTGLSTGADVKKGMRAILGATQPLSSTFNPSYSGLPESVLEAAKHRGTTFWPWTFRDEAIFERYYMAGTHGLTTDMSQWASAYPVRLSAAAAETVAANAAVELPVQIRTQAGQASLASSRQLVVVEATAPYTQSNGETVFSGPGTALVLMGHTHAMAKGGRFTIYSEPVQLTVR